MASRRRRISVVLDTNVFVRALKTRSKQSPNRRLLRLWLFKQLQIVVCEELVAEYLGVLRDVLGFDSVLLEQWRQRWTAYPTTTVVNLGRRYTESRDPDDNVLLATALVGRCRFLITNDRDLLELPKDTLRSLPFHVVTPIAFLKEFERSE